VLDEIERKGRAQGRAQGRAEGRAQTLLELIALRFRAAPEDVTMRILAADEALLSQWTARVLSAPTLEEVLNTAPKGKRASPARRAPARRQAPRRAAKR